MSCSCGLGDFGRGQVVRSFGISTMHLRGSVPGTGRVMDYPRARHASPTRHQGGSDEPDDDEHRELPFIASAVLVSLVALLIAALFFSSAIGPDNGRIIASLACLIALTFGFTVSRTSS